MDWQQIQNMANYDMEQAYMVGRDPKTGLSTHPEDMSWQQLQTIQAPTLIQTRQFLRDEIGLKKIYHGNGYTSDDDGKRGDMEYLALQKRLDDIDWVVIIDVMSNRETMTKENTS